MRSVPLGGAWALDGLWRQLGIDAAIERLLAARRLDVRAERLLFALVANRALAPFSKLACCEWLAGDVAIPGLGAEAVGEDPQPLYRAMDWLLEIEAQLAEQVYWGTADLLNLEVDLLFFDTTSTYFERDEPDPDTLDDDGVARPAFRAFGHSKDHRDDLPQVLIGMAVTRTGIPIRAWCWPGNQADQPLIRQVKDELRDWKLSRVVWVADRGFQSAENRRYLQRAGGHYVIGEKLRADSKEARAALARQGRYRTVAGNLEVKEVRVDDGTMRDRFVICRTPTRPSATRPSATSCSPSSRTRSRSPTGSARTNAPRSPPACRPSVGSSASCATPRAACCASIAPLSAPRPTRTASSCCAAQTPRCQPRTSPWPTSNCSRSSAAGAT